MSTRLLVLLFFLLLLGCSSLKQNKASGEWTPLFNGKNLDGWAVKISGHEQGENYNHTFRVEDGVLKVSYDNYARFDGEFGHLFYYKPLSNYHLRLEYRFTGEQAPGGEGWAYRNSGVMFHAQAPESMELDQDFPVCLEAQFLGGSGEGERPTGNLCTPGSHVYMGGTLITDHCTNSSSKTYHGDQWVKAELLVYGDSLIHHIIEGDTVMTYTDPIIGGGHKPEGYPLPNGSALKEGYIALQAESHPVEFRNIELKELE